MPGKLKTIDHRLLTRRCVRCGYDGILSRDHVRPHLGSRRCPRCDCDLSERPPRSYAEMEGLLGHPLVIESPRIIRPPLANEQNLIQRWLAVLFCAMMLIVLIVCLSAAAMPG